MKRTDKDKNKNYLGWYLLSFTLPLLIIFVILLLAGVYWGSQRTILASDGFHQYAIFNTTLRNALHGDGSLFYTFTSGIGLNFYALISYYLGSFLSPLVYFFDLKSMPDAIYLLTLIKFGLVGLSAFYSLHKLYKKLTPFFLLCLSTAFALMSFATSQLEINMWLDVFIMAPLIILGLHRLVNGQGRILYYVSLTALFIQNYYFGYMMAIFLAFWYLVQLSWDFRQRIRSFIDFTVVSILAGLTSLIMILPTFLDLRTHGETLTKITELQTEKSWWLDIFAKNLIGSYDTTKFGAIPMIYVGIIPFIFALAFFGLKSIKWQVKAAYGTLLGFITASFYLQPLDLFWQGMHAPNMFLHRYAWLFSLLIILMAAESLSRIQEIQLRHLAIPTAFIALGGVLTYILKGRYSFLENINFLLSLEFLVAYFIIFVLFTRKKFSAGRLALILFCFSLFEISLNSHYQVSGLDKEWNFPSKENYQQNMADIVKFTDIAKSKEKDFFRMERTAPQTGNDSMKYNYNGISQFSSIRNTSSSNTLDKLGFKSDGTNLNLRYQNNTLLMDAIFGIRYNITDVMPNKFGFSKLATSDQLSLFENANASQLAILTEKPYQDIELTNLTLDNQTKFVNQLSGLDLTYFSRLDPLYSTNAVSKNNRLTVKKDNTYLGSEFASATYTLKTNEEGQIYLSLPNLTFSDSEHQTVQVLVDDQLYNYTLDNTFAFFDLGHYQAGREVSFRLIFPDNKQVSFDQPQFYSLNLKKFQTAVEKINSKKTNTKQDGNTLTTTYQSEKEASLVYTVPYDQGWSATVNGQKASVKPAQKGLIKIDVPKGKGKVKLTFTPKGFQEGSYFFIGGILVFILYDRLKQFRKKTSKSVRN